MLDKLKKFKFKKKDNETEEVAIEEVSLAESEIENLNEQAKMMDEEEIQKNKKFFDEKQLWEKLQKFAKKAGTSVVYAVLLLYFTMKKDEVPMKVKATIAGALGYFILPFDLIPDVAVGVGYIDDLSVLMAALVTVAMYIDEDTKNEAKNKLADWFGENIDTSDIDDKLLSIS